MNEKIFVSLSELSKLCAEGHGHVIRRIGQLQRGAGIPDVWPANLKLEQRNGLGENGVFIVSVIDLFQSGAMTLSPDNSDIAALLERYGLRRDQLRPVPNFYSQALARPAIEEQKPSGFAGGLILPSDGSFASQTGQPPGMTPDMLRALIAQQRAGSAKRGA